MMELIHYSGEPFELDRTREYHQGLSLNFKPYGLWFSVGEAWKAWCEGENFCLDELKFKYRIKLNGNLRILKNEEEVDEFHNQYNTPPIYHDSLLEKFKIDKRLFENVDWQRVARDYQGIIVAPYQRRDFRKMMMWHSGWDCSSGCVWDLRAVESCELEK